MFHCACDADLTVLMLQGTKLLLWDSEMTVSLEMAVLQPTHCLLALLHFLPLQLPAPLSVPSAGAAGLHQACYTCADKQCTHRRAVTTHGIAWDVCRCVSAACGLWRTGLPLSMRLLEGQSVKQIWEDLHMYFCGWSSELCANRGTWECLTASGLECVSCFLSGQNPCMAQVLSHFLPQAHKFVGSVVGPQSGQLKIGTRRTAVKSISLSVLAKIQDFCCPNHMLKLEKLP